jgi:hypothetical protein
VAAALLAQIRKRRLRHPQGAEQIGLDLRPGLLLADLLDHAELPVSGVVDHDVEPAEVVVRLADHVEDRLAVGDVEGERGDRVAVLVHEVVQRRRVAGGRRHTVAAVEGGDGPLAAEAAGRSRDEPDL